MKMNLAETWFINSTLRVRELRSSVADAVAAHLHNLHGARVLEIGCGQGVGTELLLDRFGAGKVTALDIDPKMVRRAARRLRARGDSVEVRLGDGCATGFPDASFDAVVEFAAVHHIPNWRDGLREIARVLRPGGRFVFEDHDVTKHSWVAKVLFAHPAERFTAADFVQALSNYGIDVGDRLTDRNGHFFGVGVRA
jgi:ubiquinone/menaquinone biosynthesis C-methylase UbiE